MSSFREPFQSGVRAVAPVMVGVIPFGLVAGAAAVDAGLSGVQAVGLSVVVFAGASQLAAIELLGSNANAAVVVATMLIINLRMTMYSASIAPFLADIRGAQKAIAAYLLTDQAYALAITRFTESAVDRVPFYLGCAAPLWVVWQICTIVGVFAGTAVPGWLPLGFAVPLIFLALLVPVVDDFASVAAAVVGGGIAVAAATVPFNLGLMIGAVSGVATGVVVESVTGVGPVEVDP